MSDPKKATEPKAPYNAGDEEQVAAKREASRTRDQAIVEGLKHVMSSKVGRTWMRHLIAEKLFTRVGSVRPAGIFTGNSTTFYNTALKELGDIIATEVALHCPNEMRLMESEGDR